MGKKVTTILICMVLLMSLLMPILSFAEDDAYRIYYNGQKTAYYGYYVKGTPYLPLDIIGKYCVNPGVTVDENNMRLIIDLSLQNIMMADDETTAFVKNNAGKVYVQLKKIDKAVVFPLNTMDQFFKLSYSVENGRINIRAFSGTEKIAKVKTEGALALPSLASTTDTPLTLSQSQRVYITGETENYYMIEDFDGESYYVLKEQIILEDLDLSKLDFYAPKKQKFVQAEGQKINLAWHYATTVTPDAPASIDGLDILAPTWFRLLVEDGGNVTNGGDLGYTDLAHQNGFMVWATITNNMSETGSTNFTTKMFNTPAIMNKAIAQYIFYSCLYDVDGINIDFEDVRDADANGLVDFTSNMRYFTEKQGLTLSIDTLIPKPWTIEYDRDELIKYVDYLAIMTYDEHYGSSKTPGSVASLPWVEEAIQEALKEGVPSHKLLLGVPLYTRVWTLDSSGNITKNTAVSMSQIPKLLSENNASITYLTKEKQNLAEYSANGTTTKIWLEDEVSITNRLYLVTAYDLAGSACWQFSQADLATWDIFDRYLH